MKKINIAAKKINAFDWYIIINNKIMINIIVVGKSGVGKTSLIKRYVHDTYDDEPYEATVGMTFVPKTIAYKSSSIKLQIWDTAGSPSF